MPSNITVTLEPVDSDTIDRVESLLATNGLPHQDVRDKPDRFRRAIDGQTWIGIGGVEVYDSAGLLRSVVVREPHREQGYGTALCAALEDFARENGVETLYLLTTTAAEFFRALDYTAIPRTSAPPRLQRTTEFTEYCPASAICLRKEL